MTIEQKGLLGASLMALAGLYAAFAGGAENQSFLTAPISQAIAAEEPVDVKVQASPAAEEAEEYDEVGYASWYGDELAGRKTASGEPFLPTGISAAHRTLPFQSYVEVTSLDTGRTILVRINDRGPYARSRLIDLSRGAAEQLGVSGHGHAAVRVRRVDPLEQEKVALKQGLRASERLEAPELLLAALRKKLDYTPRTDASSAKSPPPALEYAALETASSQAEQPGSYVVQVAAFSSKERASGAAKRCGGFVDEAPNGLWRVRMGPYESRHKAQDGAAQAAKSGFQGARIMVND
ncbi:MAG: septal ring lytic transglycosylase RlpA family protein [Sphingobium sp.]